MYFDISGNRVVPVQLQNPLHVPLGGQFMEIQPKEIQLKNGRKITIRSVKPSDAENMLTHLFTSHSESYKNMNNSAEFWKSFPVEQEKTILADFEASDSKFMITAIYEGRIVGGLGFMGAQGQFHKKNGSLGMSIQNEFSNLGLGTQMMEFAIEAARNCGFHRMELSVRTYNEAGIALYEKVGFQRIGLLKEIAYIDGEFVDEFSYQFIL